MKQLRMGSLITAAVAALALSQAASAVTVSLVTDGTANELQVVVSGLGSSPAGIVSAFDFGLSFNTSTLHLLGANMHANTGMMDDGTGFYGSCAFGTDGAGAAVAAGILGACPGAISSNADLAFVSGLPDATLAGLENPGHANPYSLTIATLDFTGTGAATAATVNLVWDFTVHDMKGNTACPGPNPTNGDPGTACVIYPVNSTVPEPGTLALLGVGMLASLALVRRRQRSAR